MDSTRYKKGEPAGSKGVTFQVTLLAIFLLNALQRISNWRLSTENKRAGKFDDVVLEWPEDAILLQAKHKKKKMITLDELLSTNSKNGDFSLPKYFLSYQEIKNKFKGNKTFIICTNAGIHENISEFLAIQNICSDSMLYYREYYSFYTVKTNFLSLLKQSVTTYLTNKGLEKNAIETLNTDKNLEDFLEHLQIYANYPSGHDLENIIEKLLSSMKHSNGLYENISPLELHGKVKDWFEHEDEYLTETEAKAMFSELRTDRYWQKLEQYKVFFQNNDLHFPYSKRIFHFITENGYLLQVIKIYLALKNDKVKFLCINPDDDVAVHKQVVEAFNARTYTHLVIICHKSTEESIMTEISDTISTTLKTFQYKKIVLVTQSGAKTNQLFGLNESDVEVVWGSGTFNDLSEETRERLLNKKNIVFQGRDIGLGELFTTRDSEDFEKAANLLLPKTIEDEKVIVGTRLFDLDESVTPLYVNRTFKREIEKEGEKIFYSEDDIYNVNEKMIVIADTAGTGKTTVVTSLAAIIKETHPFLWVIKIELNDFTGILKDFLRRNRKAINVLDLLNSKDATGMTHEFDNFVFSMDKKVVLMLDGVDEISPNYTDLIISLLLHCQKASNFAKVFITTRPHVVEELKEKLKVTLFTLSPFTEESQMYYLTRYWTHNLNLRDDSDKRKCEKYAKALLHKMLLTDLNNGIEDDFAAIPLQLRMVAEIFQENMVSDEVLDWEGCKEYLQVDEEEPKLPEEMNFVKLYDMFIEKKRDIFIDKENPDGRTATTQALTDQFNKCLSYHRKFALDIVLDEKARDLFSCYEISKDMENIVLRIGIMQEANKEVNFIHRTLAEYFVADCIVRELQCQNQNVQFQKFVIDEVFRKRTYEVVLIFVDNFLQKILDAIPPTTFQSYQSLGEDYFWTNNFNIIHKLAETGCVTVLQLLLKCTNFVIIRDQEDIYDHDIRSNRNTSKRLPSYSRQDGLNIKDICDRTPLYIAASKGHLKMVKFLVEHGANINSKTITILPVEYAIHTGHFNVAKYLLEQAARVDNCDMSGCLLESNSWNKIENIMKPYLAACMGDLNALEAFIERGIEIDGTFLNGDTLICGAARNKQLHVIEYLVHKGASVNSTDDDGRTALHLTSGSYPDFPTVKLLIKLGIDISAIDIQGNTALHLAASYNTLDMVKLLVKSGADVNVRDGKGNTVIHLAASQGRLDSVQFFVESGIDLSTRNNYGQTVLHSAALIAAEEYTIRYLVEHGLDVNATDDRSRTALYVAVEHFLPVFYRCEEVDPEFDWEMLSFKCLLDQGADVNIGDEYGRTVLHLSAVEGEMDIVKLFVEAGADVNAKDKNCHTPLHLAAELEHLDIVKLLVEGGADVNAKDKNGQTPVHLAAEERQMDIVKLLVEGGADVNAKANNGKTLLHLAAEMGHLGIVKLLVEGGADVNAKDKNGQTPLHFAAEEIEMDIVKLFAERRADVNAKDKNCQTPLHLAVEERQMDIVKLLVEGGADVNAKDKNCQTPLHLAARKGWMVAKVLIELGADINCRDHEGKTPTALAKKAGHKHLLQYLETANETPRYRRILRRIFERMF